MNKRVLGIVLVLAASMAFAAVAPAFAKNFNVPEGAVRNYWTGGAGSVAVPSDWPVGGYHFSALVIYAQHVEAGTYGTGDSIAIFVPFGGFILPTACFCTNPDEASFEAALRAGTPAGSLPGNTRSVSESDLRVERHGNDVTVELVTPQTILWRNPVPGGPPVSVTIPAFTMELDEVDGSTHTDTEVPVPAGWTVYDDNMGFDATGTFACPAWSSSAYPMTGTIVMHGINTNVPS